MPAAFPCAEEALLQDSYHTTRFPRCKPGSESRKERDLSLEVRAPWTPACPRWSAGYSRHPKKELNLDAWLKALVIFLDFVVKNNRLVKNKASEIWPLASVKILSDEFQDFHFLFEVLQSMHHFVYTKENPVKQWKSKPRLLHHVRKSCRSQS